MGVKVRLVPWPGIWGSWLDTFSMWSRCVCCVFIGNGKTEGKRLGLVCLFSSVVFDRGRTEKLAELVT